jgi:hypothetical protein
VSDILADFNRAVEHLKKPTYERRPIVVNPRVATVLRDLETAAMVCFYLEMGFSVDVVTAEPL